MLKPAIVRCTLLGQPFAVLALTGNEAVSTCFTFDLELDAQATLNEPDAIIGSTAVITLQDPSGHFRTLAGTVNALVQINQRLTLSVAPKLAQGSDLTQARVFVHKTRRNIADQVLRELGYAQHQIVWHSTGAEAGLPNTFMQANESQLAFFQRLVAELGCFFWFDSDDHEEQIHLASNLAHTPFTATVASRDTARRQAMDGIDSPLQRRWKAPKPSATYATHARPLHPVQRDEEKPTNQQFLTLAAAARNRAESNNAEHQAARSAVWQLSGPYPLVASGFSSTLPPFWSPQAELGDLTALSLTHHASVYDAAHPELGLRYHIEATLISRASGYQPAFPDMPKLPIAFPAKIESSGRYADLDAHGQYQLRMGMTHNNTERLEHTQASPSVERMVPFANANQTLDTGWHFPLLDGSTVLVTLLNNDPNRPCVLGFASELGQDGPVTEANAQQNRVLTPAQNELTFDDELPAIRLQTFDGQTLLELNASSAHPYITLAAQYGLISLSAGQRQRWTVQENLIQKHGGALLEKVKTNSTATVDGQRHLQAAKHQTLHAKGDVCFTSEGNQHWQTQTKGMSVRSEGAIHMSSQGSQLTKVSDGHYHVQAPNDIALTGDGNGDLLFSNGTGGFKIDKSGNIKLFGAQITLKGQSGVTFNGDVDYELGASNEPESVDAVEPAELPVIDALVSDNVTTPTVSGLRWLSAVADVSDTLAFEFAHQNIEPNSEATISIYQIVASEQTCIATLTHPLTTDAGVERVYWQPLHDVAEGHRLLADKERLPGTPVRFRFEIDINGIVASESNLLLLTRRLRLTTEDAAPKNGLAVCYNAFEQPVFAELQNQSAEFGSVIIGPIFIEITHVMEEESA